MTLDLTKISEEDKKDLEIAEKQCKKTAYLSLFFTILLIGLVSSELALVFYANTKFNLGYDLTRFYLNRAFDIIFTLLSGAACFYTLLKKSRTIAFFTFISWPFILISLTIANFIALADVIKTPSLEKFFVLLGYIIILALAYFICTKTYYKGLVGASKYHEIMVKNNPKYKPTKRWVILCIILFLVGATIEELRKPLSSYYNHVITGEELK